MSLGNFRGKHTSPSHYIPMDHWVVCDSCGFDIRSSDIRETWDGRLVCPSDWEPRHPQDFVRSKEEDISAKGPVRPDTDPVYILDCSSSVAIANQAICNLSVCGPASEPGTLCRQQEQIPSGTFNTNTL